MKGRGYYRLKAEISVGQGPISFKVKGRGQCWPRDRGQYRLRAEVSIGQGQRSVKVKGRC